MYSIAVKLSHIYPIYLYLIVDVIWLFVCVTFPQFFTVSFIYTMLNILVSADIVSSIKNIFYCFAYQV